MEKPEFSRKIYPRWRYWGPYRRALVGTLVAVHLVAGAWWAFHDPQAPLLVNDVNTVSTDVESTDPEIEDLTDWFHPNADTWTQKTPEAEAGDGDTMPN